MHLEEDQGIIPFSMGLRHDRMELKLKLERKGGGGIPDGDFPAILRKISATLSAPPSNMVAQMEFGRVRMEIGLFL